MRHCPRVLNAGISPACAIAYTVFSARFKSAATKMVRISSAMGTSACSELRGVGGIKLQAAPSYSRAADRSTVVQPSIKSEQFGHKRGAFSGASEQRDGLVRSAHGVALFLDEAAEPPEESQVSLLHLLQEGEARPIGANDAVKVDIRVVAVTHQDLPTRRVDGRFRQDLYARIAGFEMALPALRGRLEDLGTKIAAILRCVAPEPERITLDRFAARALFRHAGP